MRCLLHSTPHAVKLLSPDLKGMDVSVTTLCAAGSKILLITVSHTSGCMKEEGNNNVMVSGKQVA